MMNNKKKGLFIKLTIVISALIIWVWTWIPVTEIVSLDMLDENAQDIRIALITDLHSCYYGKDQDWLVKRVEKEQPDLVVFGGDIFDNRLKDKNAEIVIKRLSERYPSFYVTGNHEYWSERAGEMKETVRNMKVSVLEGDCESISFEGVTLDICGVDDPTYMSSVEWEKQIQEAYGKTQDPHINILVSHRPEKVSVYERYDFDLILSGHAHGGQFRIPFINKGLLAPGQGFMAEYVNGRYTLSNGSIMVVSRGLARETTPLPRLFNHPEVVILDLTH